MIKAIWTIELNCECPSCKENINLIDSADFFWTHTLSIETIYNNNLEVVCPKCNHEFTVCCVW